jgi:hypothetical protein
MMSKLARSKQILRIPLIPFIPLVLHEGDKGGPIAGSDCQIDDKDTVAGIITLCSELR